MDNLRNEENKCVRECVRDVCTWMKDLVKTKTKNGEIDKGEIKSRRFERWGENIILHSRM